ncbi:MAG: hypothetical protein IPL52_11235 [Flavobacteriales bacterium]|nr:hypothetical protein [Flavobacteriales bacterium]
MHYASIPALRPLWRALKAYGSVSASRYSMRKAGLPCNRFAGNDGLAVVNIEMLAPGAYTVRVNGNDRDRVLDLTIMR